MRQVDPLEPQPGDFVRAYTPHDKENPDHPINWDEGVVSENNEEHIKFGWATYTHALDEEFETDYYMVEDEA